MTETHIGTGTEHSKYNVVYEKATPEIYDQWAKDGYNEQAGRFSRGSLKSVSSKCQQHLAHTSLKVVKTLDAGCGTGNVAEVCNEDLANKKCSFRYDWWGLDFSEAMLEVARQKHSLFTNLVQGDLKKTLPYKDDFFDLVVSAGTFLQGHVGSEAVPELCRILKPNGYMIFTVRPQLFQDTREAWFSQLSKGGMTIVGVDMMPYAEGMEAPVISCIKGPMKMTVSNNKGASIYMKAARDLFMGMGSEDLEDGRTAMEAKPPVKELLISGLGQAIPVATATAARVEADGLGRIAKIETCYSVMPSGRSCAQIQVTVERAM
ncbi:unnamed protein product [Prorocentrum cordatum]|uniref:Methyltransferase type 11 domain-containing protein n=1 Tax=Prorocentrum cordatum TaxID=2364126 RepID=A0ABN9VK91_9DINO|nr:unnamed protein product [Polarella glacialis]